MAGPGGELFIKESVAGSGNQVVFGSDGASPEQFLLRRDGQSWQVAIDRQLVVPHVLAGAHAPPIGTRCYVRAILEGAVKGYRRIIHER